MLQRRCAAFFRFLPKCCRIHNRKYETWHELPASNIKRLLEEKQTELSLESFPSPSEFANIARAFQDIKNVIGVSHEKLVAAGVTDQTAWAIEKLITNLTLSHVKTVFTRDFKEKKEQYRAQQVKALQQLKQSFAHGNITVPESSKVVYWDAMQTDSISLNLGRTYPPNKYAAWEKYTERSSKGYAAYFLLNFARTVHRAILVGALSGSGKTYFEFHLAKNGFTVIPFVGGVSWKFVASLEKIIAQAPTKSTYFLYSHLCRRRSNSM